MIGENIIIYLGLFLSMLASIFLFVRGNRIAGALLVIGFLFNAQGVLYMQLVGHPEGTGACWATVQDYYSCLPISAKISMHLGQASMLFLAAGIFFASNSKIGGVHGS